MKLFRTIAVAVCATGIAARNASSRRRKASSRNPRSAIAVGGKAGFYYLPLTIAERHGYFKDEGLDVEISDFAGGSKALQALVGGSVDVVSGAYEHTIDQQAKGHNMQGFVLQGTLSGHLGRHRQGEGGALQVAEGSQGHEDRRHRAGLEHQHGAGTCSPRTDSSPTTFRSSASAPSAGAVAAMTKRARSTRCPTSIR